MSMALFSNAKNGAASQLHPIDSIQCPSEFMLPTTAGTATSAMKKIRTSIGTPRINSTYSVARLRKKTFLEIRPNPVINPRNSAKTKAYSVVWMVIFRPMRIKLNASE